MVTWLGSDEGVRKLRARQAPAASRAAGGCLACYCSKLLCIHWIFIRRLRVKHRLLDDDTANRNTRTEIMFISWEARWHTSNEQSMHSLVCILYLSGPCLFSGFANAFPWEDLQGPAKEILNVISNKCIQSLEADEFASLRGVKVSEMHREWCTVWGGEREIHSRVVTLLDYFPSYALFYFLRDNEWAMLNWNHHNLINWLYLFCF